MTCPWCGSPVIIRGSQWECGYCGDHGLLAPVPPPQQKNTQPEKRGRLGRALLWIAVGLALICFFVALNSMN